MAHNIDFSNNRANIAFLGSRKDIWHRLGTEMKPGQSTAEWAKAAGLDWEAIKVDGIVDLSDARFSHLSPEARRAVADNFSFIVRSDTGSVLGNGTDQFQIHQPAEVLDWFDKYIAVDDRFAIDVAGSLLGGKKIWATATFKESFDVAGEAHKARLLMSTAFDGTASTINKGVTERVVCNNTLDIALGEIGPTIRTTHRSKFDASKVSRELAEVAKGFARYKAVGDALAQHELSKQEISDFFKACLDIGKDEKYEDLSGRKQNQFDAVATAYKTTCAERNGECGDAWAALQAITRYVDHDRATRKGDNPAEAQFASTQFGSGNQLKGKALGLLMPLVKDKVLVAA